MPSAAVPVRIADAGLILLNIMSGTLMRPSFGAIGRQLRLVKPAKLAAVSWLSRSSKRTAQKPPPAMVPLPVQMPVKLSNDADAGDGAPGVVDAVASG